MPSTASIIDELRAAFGKESIDASIRKGIAGRPGWFHAREAGHEVGTAFPVEPGVTVEQLRNGTEEDSR